MNKREIGLYAVLLSCSSGVLPALAQGAGQSPGQTPGQTASQTPGQTTDNGIATLRVETREVILDIVVTDKKGNFVGGLKQGDFSVLEDEVEQRIRSFQSPERHAIPAGTPEVHSTADLQKIGNAPVTILVLDELDTPFTGMVYARESLEKWLNAQPAVLTQPTILLVASDQKFGVIKDFTQDRAALLQALKAHFPAYPFKLSKGGNIGPDAGERMAISLGTLTQIAQASSGTPGLKNVIWVGVGFPQLLLDDVSGTKEDEITKAAIRTTDVLLKARVTLSIIDPTAMADRSLDLNNPDYNNLGTLTGSIGPSTEAIAGVLNFDTFAPATGGHLYFGNNDIQGQINQAVNNAQNFYTLSYSPSNHSDDATQFRNIRIVMRDPNLTATTRTGYFSDAKADVKAPPPPPAVHDLIFDLTSAALSSITYNGIHAETQKTDKGYVLQTHIADLMPHVLTNGDRTAEVTVMEVFFGAKNQVLSHPVHELTMPLPQGNAPGATLGFVVLSADAPKGTVRVRFVIRAAISGHIGTVDVNNP